VAWYRKGDEEHDGCVTVICNGKVEVGKEHAGEKWTDAMGWHQGEVTIDEGESVRLVPRKGSLRCIEMCLPPALTLLQRDGESSSRLPRAFRSGPRRMPGGATSSRRSE
jgi:hypothetical protein